MNTTQARPYEETRGTKIFYGKQAKIESLRAKSNAAVSELSWGYRPKNDAKQEKSERLGAQQRKMIIR